MERDIQELDNILAQKKELFRLIRVVLDANLSFC